MLSDFGVWGFRCLGAARFSQRVFGDFGPQGLAAEAGKSKNFGHGSRKKSDATSDASLY